MEMKQNKKLEYSDIEKIEREISLCLQDIDQRYYNPKFNLIVEIIKIFGDIKFEKVKDDIDKLNKIDEKLDRVIKLIVDKHSEEFFQILGFVRQMQKRIENTKYELDDAKEILESVNKTISNLSTKENAEWKLKSIFCSEIIQKLNQNHMILKLIYDSEIYLKNKKIFDVISLLKKCNNEIDKYDKEFRRFDTVVSNNTRILEIDKSISKNLIDSLNTIIYFSDEDLLQKKINSLNIYFLSFYSKISIDNEIAKPLQKFMHIIVKMIETNMKSYNFEIEADKIEQYLNENTIDLDSEKKLTYLPYIVKCLRHYDNSFKLFVNFNDKMKLEFNKYLERTFKIITDLIKFFDYTKYDLENSLEKIKFLLFFQNFLIIFFHSFAKMASVKKYIFNSTIEEKINEYILELENIILIPLNIYFRIAAPRNTQENQQIEENSEYFTSENLIRMKINEILFTSVDNLPMLLKIYHKFSLNVEKLLNIKLKNVNKVLSNYNKILFQHFNSKIVPKKIFSMDNFTKDFDYDISNFKFIHEIITKIDKLRYLSIFAFEDGYLEIVKILKDLFNKFTEDTKNFQEKIKEKLIYKIQFSAIYTELGKLVDISEISKKLEFKKFEKSIIETSENINRKKLNNMIISSIWNGVISPEDQVILLSRNYKLLELIVKFISLSTDLICIGENFITDLMKQEFTKEKIIAIQEQVNSIHFIDFAKDTKDFSFSVIIALKTLDKFSTELGKLCLMCRLELDFSLVKLIKNINKNDYWLLEAQMIPEYFVNSFIDEFNILNNLFNDHLPSEQYKFIIKDFFVIFNFSFINCVKNIQSNIINNFGINLLVRNFEFIKEKILVNLEDSSFMDREENYKNKFMNSILYFPNFIKVLNVSQENIEILLKKYIDILPFDEDFIQPILIIRTSMRNTISETDKNKIIDHVFKSKK